jgi:hypothetical protein
VIGVPEGAGRAQISRAARAGAETAAMIRPTQGQRAAIRSRSRSRSEMEPLHPRNDTFPGEVFLRLAADALEWCGASRAEPLSLEGLRERYLPECVFRGRQLAKLQYAVLAAAAVHGGTEPDLLDEVAWWQSDGFWQYAMYAAAAYIRAAASRAGVPVRQACQDLNDYPGHPAL